MGKHAATSIYESLAATVLPDGILDVFEVTRVNEEHTGIKEETVLERRILHIELRERELWVALCDVLRPNGFTEPILINDFPIRDRKVVLRVFRRRWLDSGGRNVVLPHESLTAPDTRYSKEFAGVLKKTFGYIPYTGPLSGAVL